MERIKNLLNQVKINSEKNTEILDATGARFNIFKVCGVNHYENTHSAIIAEFLNPNGTHGLNSKLLKEFIELFAEESFKNSFSLEKAKVFTEYSTLYGRIDILIEDSNQSNAIIIENKLYATDQYEQLNRYNTYAQKYKSYQIFYLTLSGNEASEHSGKDVNYICLSYEKDIVEWLEKSVAIAVHFPMVRETINQYVNHLKTLTNQDMDTKNKEELVKMIITEPGYIKSASEVHQVWEACKQGIIHQLVPRLQEIEIKLNLQLYIGDNLGLNATGFWFKKPEWDYSILFWFESNHFMSVGIDDWELPNNVKCSEDKKNRLKEFLRDFTIHKPVNHNWMWGTIFDAWNDCAWEEVEKVMPKEIEEITIKILNKLSTFED